MPENVHSWIHSCPRWTWYQHPHNRNVRGNVLLKDILQFSSRLPSPHPGGLRILAAAGPSVCSAALPEGSSPPWGPEPHQGACPLGPPAFEWADESGNEFKMLCFLKDVANWWNVGWVWAQSTCWSKLRPPDTRLVIIWKEKRQETLTTDILHLQGAVVFGIDQSIWKWHWSNFWGGKSLRLCTCAVLICWDTLSKLQLSSESLGSTTSRQAGPLLVIRMMAWSLTLSTRRLMSLNSSSTRWQHTKAVSFWLLS